MNAQADFFAINPNSQFSTVSNNNYQAFNEFIHLFVEQGVIGVVFFLTILFLCRKSIYFPLVLSWCIFATFSYPADIPIIMLILIIGIGLCSSFPIFVLAFNRILLLVFTILIPFVIATNIRYHRALRHTESVTVCEFPQNMEYMLRFAKQKNNIMIFERVTQDICSSSEILCDMGYIYLQNGNIKKADSCYQVAHKMVPCRITPLHKLLLLYQQKDSIHAKNYAIQILNFKPTIIGSAVLRAYSDAKKALNY